MIFSLSDTINFFIERGLIKTRAGGQNLTAAARARLHGARVVEEGKHARRERRRRRRGRIAARRNLRPEKPAAGFCVHFNVAAR